MKLLLLILFMKIIFDLDTTTFASEQITTPVMSGLPTNIPHVVSQEGMH
jgi:hypothetical protein